MDGELGSELVFQQGESNGSPHAEACIEATTGMYIYRVRGSGCGLRTLESYFSKDKEKDV